MDEEAKFTDTALVRKCIDRDEVAWRIFFRRSQPIIVTRIKQIFFRHSFRYTTGDLQDAFDAVIDHFLYGKALNGFVRDESLDGYIRTVSTRAAIDWYRARTSARKLHGLSDLEVFHVTKEVVEVDLDVESVSHGDNGTDQFCREVMTVEECALLAILLIRTKSISEKDLEAIAHISKDTHGEIMNKLNSIKAKLDQHWEKNYSKFESLQFLWVQIAVCERRGQMERVARKKNQYDVKLAEYHKKGLEPYPTRKEIAELLHWDINKVDRLYRKLVQTLEVHYGDKSQEYVKSA
jgi:DNA-directed RNA polymerase specialized sigma24 family protein